MRGWLCVADSGTERRHVNTLLSHYRAFGTSPSHPPGMGGALYIGSGCLANDEIHQLIPRRDDHLLDRLAFDGRANALIGTDGGFEGLGVDVGRDGQLRA